MPRSVDRYNWYLSRGMFLRTMFPAPPWMTIRGWAFMDRMPCCCLHSMVDTACRGTRLSADQELLWEDGLNVAEFYTVMSDVESF